MALSLLFSNPGYNLWTQDHGYFTLLGGSYNQAKLESQNNLLTREDAITRIFTIAVPANDSLLTVRAMRYVGVLGSTGYAYCRVRLQKPDSSWVTLYTGSGNLSWQNIINNADITAYLATTTTYHLRFEAEVISGYELGTYDHSYVIFETVTAKADLDPPAQVTGVSVVPMSTTKLHITWNSVSRADTYTVKYKKAVDPSYTSITGITDVYKDLSGLSACTSYNVKVSASNESGEGTDSAVATQRTNCAYTKTLTETVSHIETFNSDKHVWRIFEDPLSLIESIELLYGKMQLLEFSEPLNLQEGFTIRKFSPLDSSATKILACLSTDVAVFTTGTAIGYYDTDDLDFARPGEDKILDYIEFVSQAETPHTLEVWVSTDSGTTWEAIGQDVTYRGKNATVSPWITGEKFRFRFKGAGPYLQSIYATAIPVGGEIDND